MQLDTDALYKAANVDAKAPLLLAVDPGREKSGVAVMTKATATLVYKAIVPTAELETSLTSVLTQFKEIGRAHV